MGKKIDYSMRPSKYVERKMFADLFRKMFNFDVVDNYQYIGFGSIYFRDFITFHKELNIKNMVSIEKNTSEKDRYVLNKPYKFIKMKFGSCEEVIGKTIEESKCKSLIWLDFDSFFDIEVILDSINEVVNNIMSGSLLLVSFNINNNINTEKLTRFNNKLASYLSIDLKEVNFQPATIAKTYKKIIDNYIEVKLKERNIKNNCDELNYNQLIFTKYKDSIDMLTIGGIFINKEDEKKLTLIKFNDYDFVSTNDDIYIINVPILTPKEIQIFDNEIVKLDKDIDRILHNDFEEYKKIYRYYPHYFDSNIL